jgi:hypothetical protein
MLCPFALSSAATTSALINCRVQFELAINIHTMRMLCILTWLMLDAVKSTCKAREPFHELPWLCCDHSLLVHLSYLPSRLNKEGSIHQQILL